MKQVLKLCEGAITYVSTVTGGREGEAEVEAGKGDATSGSGSTSHSNSSGSSGKGTTTYVVVAGEDGAVRFYDLKFRVEVSQESFSNA